MIFKNIKLFDSLKKYMSNEKSENQPMYHSGSIDIKTDKPVHVGKAVNILVELLEKYGANCTMIGGGLENWKDKQGNTAIVVYRDIRGKVDDLSRPTLEPAFLINPFIGGFGNYSDHVSNIFTIESFRKINILESDVRTMYKALNKL